ncbi:O-acetylhomoserine aminocarboxypropyltransferase/cysteine synthase [Eubacterium saphenum ATCC 49989]|nr:O-acetylhomoserine aminocarboxypropyltransferase/cysteine synthase [Eubacterium saphenum ATCC 49989]
MKKGFNTKCIHGNYLPKSGEPQVMPIVQSTTYRYYDNDEVAALFDLESLGSFYSRLGNPTVDNLEAHIALLEGGTGAICTSSGQAANLICMLNIAKAGDHIISSNSIYGGTFNLFSVTLKKMGIDVEFVDQDLELEELKKYVKPNTKVVFAETLANPKLSVLDIEKFKKLSEFAGVLLIVDNTLATPALLNPIEYGADIVTHSTTKYIDGHGNCVGGCVVEAGTFDYSSGKYPEFIEPDDSYHGIVFYEKFGDKAFTVKLRAQMLRDLGTTMSPMNAFLTDNGLKTLALRMERHSQNAIKLAEFLNDHDKISYVTYPGLSGDKYYELSKKYMKKGQSGVLSFGIKGGYDAGVKLIKNLKLTSLVVHVGDINTSTLHPASSTHRQLSEDELKAAGIGPELIRVSVGLCDIEDIIEDFENALKCI